MSKITEDIDPTAEERKRDHIELAFKSQIASASLDNRFYYEPLLSAHPKKNDSQNFDFLKKEMRVPIWVSSMTGGTQWAGTINKNLAKAAKDFGMGMGLGSCRSLLSSDEHLADFNVRPIIGPDLPLYANLGIAQLETLLLQKSLDKVQDLLQKLDADGLIIHVNPFQEWLQPEGDHFQLPPIEVIEAFIDHFPQTSVIVKEVGQGMGYESLKRLFQLPIDAIDFAASGGTNFAMLEMLRASPEKLAIYQDLAKIGHSAVEMVDLSNKIKKELGDKMRCNNVIISGGVKNFLDGYYLINKLAFNAVYGQASAFLKYARDDYASLYTYVESQVKGLELANAYLRLK